MKKTKILTPILTLGTLGAAVTPMTILTSCHKKNTGKDANLVEGYDCEFEAAEKVAYKTTGKALQAYLNIIDPQTNADAIEILKDDARYAYSLGFQTNNFKNDIKAKYSYYTLDFDEIEIDHTEGSEIMKVTFVIKVKGSFDDSELKVDDAELECRFRMVDGFGVEFHQANKSETNEELNYISCTPKTNTAKYYLKGKCTIDGNEYGIQYKPRECDISVVPSAASTEEEICGYMIKQFVLTGLTCNYIDIGGGDKGGALYTHYLSQAVIE